MTPRGLFLLGRGERAGVTQRWSRGYMGATQRVEEATKRRRAEAGPHHRWREPSMATALPLPLSGTSRRHMVTSVVPSSDEGAEQGRRQGGAAAPRGCAGLDALPESSASSCLTGLLACRQAARREDCSSLGASGRSRSLFQAVLAVVGLRQQPVPSPLPGVLTSGESGPRGLESVQSFEAMT